MQLIQEGNIVFRHKPWIKKHCPEPVPCKTFDFAPQKLKLNVFAASSDKDRFCNTIATVALMDTLIQSY